MTKIDIPQHETGLIRVFSVSMPDDRARALKQGMGEPDGRIAELLGVTAIDTTRIDLFRVADLDEIGLAGYLVEGSGAKREAIDRDRARLANLEGWVLVVYSTAFGGAAQRVEPVPELTLIGTYEEERPDMVAPPITSDAAKPYTGPGTGVPATPTRRGAGGSLMVIAVILFVVALIVWLAIA